jgi:Asp-tRNA(Asn)/Glu-tRNA(Gln) amidotransferase A subunit family amidase
MSAGDTVGPTVAEIARDVRSRAVSPVELVQDALSRAERDTTNSFLTLCGERALGEARVAEALQMRAEELPPLLGVPIGIKDLDETEGVRTTYGSLRFADHVPDEDCVAVARLRAAGAIVIGKTNTPAFGLLGETKNRLGPPCGNPHDPEYTAGGSSGGSAAAVAAGIVPAATGSDSAGSINVPAAWCGVYGLKPTLGRVPQVPVSDSLMMFTVTGPITRTPRDAALLLETMSVYDPRDPMSLNGRVPAYSELIDTGLPGPLRVGVSTELAGLTADQDVVTGVFAVADRLRSVGCLVEPAEPRLEQTMELYIGLYVPDSRRSGLASPEALSELYPESVAELADLPQATAEDYVALLNRLWRLQGAMREFFSEYDLLLMPTTGTGPFLHDHPPDTVGGRRVTPGWTTFMPFTPIVSMSGQPAANIPAGSASTGLPVGALLVGRHGAEDVLLSVSHALMGD